MKQFLNKNTPYLFISPALFLLLLFSLLPILLAFVISFTDIDLVGLADYSKINFVGVDNYVNIMQDPVFLKSIFNTLFYVIIGVPLVIVCSLGIALMINFSQAKIFQFFRLIFYTPSITNVVAVAVVWSYLYNPRFGLLNYLLVFRLRTSSMVTRSYYCEIITDYPSCLAGNRCKYDYFLSRTTRHST